MQETPGTWVQSLGQGDPLEEGMAAHSSILAWRIPQTEEPGWLQSMGSQRVGLGCDWAHAHLVFFSSYLSLIKSKMKALLVLISWLTTPLISVLGSFSYEVLGTFNNTFLQVYLVLLVLRPAFQFYFNRQKLKFFFMTPVKSCLLSKTSSDSLWPKSPVAWAPKCPMLALNRELLDWFSYLPPDYTLISCRWVPSHLIIVIITTFMQM